MFSLGRNPKVKSWEKGVLLYGLVNALTSSSFLHHHHHHNHHLFFLSSSFLRLLHWVIYTPRLLNVRVIFRVWFKIRFRLRVRIRVELGLLLFRVRVRVTFPLSIQWKVEAGADIVSSHCVYALKMYYYTFFKEDRKLNLHSMYCAPVGT